MTQAAPTNGLATLAAAVRSREGIVLATGTAALLLLLTIGRPTFFRAHLEPMTEGWAFPGLWGYVWSSLSSVAFRMLLPLAVIVGVLRESPRDWGYAAPASGGFSLAYLLLLCVMIPVVWTAAGADAFQRKYPLWEGADTSIRALLAYEARYFLIFLSGESFWRGFLLFGLARRYGWSALSLAMVPYVLVHFGKPVAETLGAIITAYVLGALALRHRTFWWGVALHYAVAVTMDVASLIRGDRFPTDW